MKELPQNRTFLMATAGLALICLGGGWLRLHNLDLAAMGPDRMEIWKTMARGVPVWDLLTDPKGVTGWFFFPFSLVTTRLFLDLFQLDPTFAHVRLPFALLGTLAIPAAFGCGKTVLGWRGGLWFALLIALHPFAIQMSRECYFYAPTMLGAVLSLWALLWFLRGWPDTARWPVGFHLLNAAGFFILVHNRAIGWPPALLHLLVIGGGFALAAYRARTISRDLTICVLSYLAIGLPVVFAKWGLSLMFSEEYRQSTQFIHGGGVPFFDPPAWVEITKAWAFGSTPFRVGLLLACALTLPPLFLAPRLRIPAAFVLAFGGISFFICAYASVRTGFPMSARYGTAIFPLFLFLISLGVFHLMSPPETLPTSRRRAMQGAGGLLAVASLAALAPPAFISTQATGEPHPYQEIADWADAQFAPGTPILCDRYFTAYHEFRVNAPKHVRFMSPIPNEPLERFRQMRWRDLAKDYFVRNPDAAYFEQGMYFKYLGPWDWPETYFARKKEFRDEANIHLARLGLSFRSTGVKNPEDKLTTTIYYNTHDDLKQRARREGQRSLLWFAEGWDMTQTRDARTWRSMTSEAALNLDNLTDAPLAAELLIEAVSVQADVTLQLEPGGLLRFPAQRPVQQRVPLTLAPGESTLRLRVLKPDAARSLLLFSRIELHPARSAPAR